MIQFVAGVLIAVAIFATGYKAGHAVSDNDALMEAAARDAKVIAVDRIVIREVPKIITKVVTKEVQVEKEVERVVTVVEKSIPADCVLPDNYGLLLVSAARGLDPEAPGTADAAGGTYGCREVLAATLSDLRAGWRNTARLDGLQEWVRLVTKE